MKDEVLGFGEEMRAATADEEAIVGVEVVVGCWGFVGQN